MSQNDSKKGFICLGLHALGISNKKLRSLLHLDFSESGSSPDFAIDIRDSSINWLNDIEQDSKFRYWSSSLMDLLRPTFPGMLRQIRKNLYNLVSDNDFVSLCFFFYLNV